MAAKPSFVLSHRYHLFDSFQESPQSFYNRLGGRVKERSIPDVMISRVDYYEGGMLSAKREYLPVLRMRYVFDICAALFGNGLFVSWWLTKVLSSRASSVILAIIRGALLLLVLAISALDLLAGLFVTLVALAIVLAVLATGFGFEVLPWGT